MRKTLLSIVLLMLFFSEIRAQSTVTGRVTSADDGEPLPGVTVLEKGTSNGAITDVDGNYSITLTGSDATLVVRYVGFLTSEIAVGGRSAVDVNLELDITSLDEVVVTAFGIERQLDAVGYATAKVKEEEFAEAKQISVAQTLAGKVAGVNITAPPTGPGGSTNVIIRGLRDLNGDNRPLLVVDGVIVSNEQFEPAGRWGGRDNGDGFSSLNPDDIASMDILKGAAASTLYGTAAQGGVILVTTKKGRARKGIGVELTSNFMVDQVAIFPDFQDQFGAGNNGLAPSTQAEAQTQNSWGGRLNGQNAVSFDGTQQPYSAIDRRENLKNYYETGTTFTNTLALTGGTENFNTRFSISNLDNQGIVPTSTYDRFSVNLVSSAKLGERVSAEAKFNYVLEEAFNRPELSDNPSNPAKSLSRLPANVDINRVRENVRDANGNPVLLYSDIFNLNPYWGPFENINSDSKDRVISYFKLGYDVTDWLTIQGRISLDYVNVRLNRYEELGTPHNVNGAVNNDNRTFNVQSHDLLLLGNTDFNEDISLSYTLGLNQFRRTADFFRASGSLLVQRDKRVISNAQERNAGEFTENEQERNAIFGNANIGYRGFAYLDLAGRQEWLSTLTNPLDLINSNNTLTYGSISGSFILNEALDLPAAISYVKLRASYGTAGGGTDPYNTSLFYQLEGDPIAGAVNGRIGNSTFPNPDIKPSRTVSREIGLNASFADDRISIDATWYQTNTTDQILEADVSVASAYERISINAGEVQNSGFELLLSGYPVIANDFSWNVSFNMALNDAEVLSLTDQIEQIAAGGGDAGARRAGISVQHAVGRAPSALLGREILRDDQGRIVHGTDGLPMAGPEDVELGNYNPDFIGGITNRVSYKNFSLSFLIDMKFGAQISSLTKWGAFTTGLHKETLVGRDNDSFTIVGEGVDESGQANIVSVPVDSYYTALANIGETTIEDADYIKLRELRLNYQFPSSFLSNIGVTRATIGVVGRNLFFFQNDLSELGIDPEALYNTTNATGLEYAALPSTRSYGVNLKLTF